MNRNLAERQKRFLSDEDGSATIMGTFFLLAGAVVLGLAVDQANGWKVRTQMQIATDAAALAAAANLSDTAYAQALALEVANMNLPTENAITANDISFGYIDLDTYEFVASAKDDGSYDAVRVDAERTSGRSNAVPTFLMKLIGNNFMDVTVATVAAGQQGVNGGGFAGCEDAVFLSTKTVQTGGGNELNGAVCIHGERGLATGGGDLYNPEVRLSAEEFDDIYLASYGPENLPEAQIKVARSMTPVLLPRLDEMRSSIWADLWKSRDTHADLWEQPDAPWGGKEWYYIGEYELSAADYDGILPSFVFDETGNATVHMRENYWSIQPGDLEPHTIYLSSQGIQFSGGVDIEDVAIISQADIGVGGGPKLYFDDVYFIGTNLNFSGSVDWGAPTTPCQIEYGVYTFGTQSLSLGGWNSGSRVSGMVGAAPRFEPGGAMQGTGVYFESDSHLNLGGNMDISGCGTARSSEYTLADMSVEISASTGSYLYR